MDLELRRDRRELVRDVLPTLQTGDIILCSYKSPVAGFLNFFQKDKVIWGHCLLVKDNTTAWEAKHAIKESSTIDLFKNKKYWKIIRHIKVNDKKRALINRIMPILLGNEYSFKRFFLHALDNIFGTDMFTSSDSNTNSQVCSSLVGWAYEIAFRYRFTGKYWTSCDPDDIEDDVEKHPENWVILAEKLPKER